MKHMVLIFVFSLLFLISCSEQSTRKNSSSNQNAYCMQYPYAQGCNGGMTAGGNIGGTVGGNTGSLDQCYQSTSYYWQMPGCPGFCQSYPTHQTCAGATTGTTTSGGIPGQPGVNPHPHYYSGYVDKNWLVHYPFAPSISCSPAVAPNNIDYTPYETRKGSITLKGQVNYDPASGQQFFDTTSELLQSVSGSKNFFWADSILKIRLKANLQPESRNTTSVCPGRVTGMTSTKGYGKIKFDLYLVGTRANNTTSTVSLGTKEVVVNSCSPAIDLSSYAEQFPNGIYLKVSNVYGNQNWSPGTNNEQQIYDTYGFVSPQNPHVSNSWKLIRNAECWSLDIEVAADGTKTFN
jgi:hypothetical protein